MNSDRKVVLCLAGLGAVALAVMLRWPGTEGAPSSDSRSTAVVPDRPASEPRVEPPRADGERALASEQPVPVAPSPTSAHFKIRGRVFGVDGGPLSGVPIGIVEDNVELALGASSDGGRFELDLLSLPATLQVETATWVTVRVSPVSPNDLDVDHVLIVANPVLVYGRVIDEQARPVADSEVELKVLDEALSRVDDSLETTARITWIQHTADDGYFAFDRAPQGVDRLELRGRAVGYEETVLELASESALTFDPVQLVLKRSSARSIEVFGTVRTSGGEPIAGAKVVLGKHSTTSGSAGDFRLSASSVTARTPLCAMASPPGFGIVPDCGERIARALESGMAEVGPIDLVISGESLGMSGHVAYDDGKPAPGFAVYVVDGTLLDLEGDFPPRIAETESTGSAYEHVTAQDGRFEIAGLARRNYKLQIRDLTSAATWQVDDVPAGTQDLRILVPKDLICPRVQGVLLSLSGRPLAGVDIGVQVATTDSGRTSNGPSTRSAEDGSFALEHVPNSGAWLVVQGSEVVRSTRPLPRCGESNVELRVEAICKFRVDISSQSLSADAITLRNAQQEVLPIITLLPDGSSEAVEAYSFGGLATPILRVSEQASHLEFLLNGIVVRSVPIRLFPKLVTVIP